MDRVGIIPYSLLMTSFPLEPSSWALLLIIDRGSNLKGGKRVATSVDGCSIYKQLAQPFLRTGKFKRMLERKAKANSMSTLLVLAFQLLQLPWCLASSPLTHWYLVPNRPSIYVYSLLRFMYLCSTVLYLLRSNFSWNYSDPNTC
jgi:hypothetical protein